MQGGGSVRSWFVPAGSPAFRGAVQALGQLESVRNLALLAAVGDGNHSLASAKAHWDLVRKSAGPDHPARYALVELINIHDEGLGFEPIHRVIFGLSPERFLEAAGRWFAGQDFIFSEVEPSAAYRSMFDLLPAGVCRSGTSPGDPPAAQMIPLVCSNRTWMLKIQKPVHSLTAGSLQPFLDNLVRLESCRVDYVHGTDVVRRLADGGALGMLLPALDKNAFFSIISRESILPRKTFSMGEAREKRYYFECRRIT
jgi:hypothetical protein